MTSQDPQRMVLMTVRVQNAVVRRLDEIAERMRQERSGLQVTRSDVVRMLLDEALAAREKTRA